MNALAHAHRLRRGRVSESERAYLLTTVTRRRLCVFDDFELARQTIGELRACDEAGLSTTLAFVLMPDHLHWLIQLHDTQLSALIQRVKSRSAAAINRVRGTQGATLWQAGFHDRAVRDGENLRDIARYVIANPVRAGLCRSVGAYPHWDAAWL